VEAWSFYVIATCQSHGIKKSKLLEVIVHTFPKSFRINFRFSALFGGGRRIVFSVVLVVLLSVIINIILTLVPITTATTITTTITTTTTFIDTNFSTG
jgi:hypothetical protein